MSLPAWERGLKHFDAKNGTFILVAPRVGAWIETSQNYNDNESDIVAPRVGAWIETSDMTVHVVGMTRRSPRGSVD